MVPALHDRICPQWTCFTEADRGWYNLQLLVSVKPFALVRKELLLRNSYFTAFEIFFVFKLPKFSTLLSKEGTVPQKQWLPSIFPSSTSHIYLVILLKLLSNCQDKECLRYMLFMTAALLQTCKKNKSFHCCFNSFELLNAAAPKHMHLQCRKKNAVLKSTEKKGWHIFSCHFLTKTKQLIAFLQLRYSLNTIYFGSSVGIKTKMKINTFPERLMGVNQGCILECRSTLWTRELHKCA